MDYVIVDAVENIGPTDAMRDWPGGRTAVLFGFVVVGRERGMGPVQWISAERPLLRVNSVGNGEMSVMFAKNV